MKSASNRMLRRVIFFLIVVVILVALGVFAAAKIKGLRQSGLSLYALPADPGRIYEAQEGLMTIQNGMLVRMDAQAKPLFSAELEDNSAKACGNAELTAIYHGPTVRIYDNNGTLLVQHTLESDILDMVMGTESYAIVFQQDGQRRVSVFRMDTTPLDENILFPYQSVLDLGLFDADKQLWTLSLDVHATQPVSMIKTRNIGLTTTASLSVDGEIVYCAKPYRNGFVTVGTQSLKMWDSKGSETLSQMIYGWILQDIEEDSQGRMQCIFCPADPEESGVKTMLWYIRLEADGTTTQYRYSLPTDTLAACLTSKGIAAVTPTQIISMPCQGGRMDAQDLSLTVSSAQVLEYSHGVILREGDQEYLLKLD